MWKLLIGSESERCTDDYDQTTPAELEVFGLDGASIGNLRDGYWRYMDFVGLCDPPGDEVQSKNDRANVTGFEMAQDISSFVFSNYVAAKFMADVCGLPYRDSYLYCMKVEAAQFRLGLIETQE